MPIIPTLGRLSQEDHEFKASLGYIVSLRLTCKILSLKKKKKKTEDNVLC
jgi:hypothetical protein